MNRVEYFEGSKTRLTRGFLDFRSGDGAPGAEDADFALPT